MDAKKTFYSNDMMVHYYAIDPSMLAMPPSHAADEHVVPPTPTPLLDPSTTPFSPDDGLDDFPVMYRNDDPHDLVDVAVAQYLGNYHTGGMMDAISAAAAAAMLNPEQQQHLFPALAKMRLFECHICHRQFNRRFNLTTHIKTHDKSRYRPFGCPDCPKRFDRKHDCKRHVQTVHMGVRLYHCDKCQAGFSRKDALIRHKDQKHHHGDDDDHPPVLHAMYD